MITIVHPLFLSVILVLSSSTFFSSSSPTADEDRFSNCDRNCPAGDQNGKRVPYPFGFSSSCEIPLNCSETGEIKIGEFHVRNVTADSIFINFPGNCDRPIESLDRLFGRNYRITSRNSILLQNCSSPINGCSIPSSLFKNNNCGSANVSCYPDNNSNIYFLDLDMLKSTRCGKVFSSVTATRDTDQTMALDYQSTELEWWLNGNSCACSRNANCTTVTLGNRGMGYRCQCFEGYAGDGFISGEGCHKGTSKLNIIPIIAAAACGLVLLVILVFCYKRKFVFSILLHLWKPKTKHQNVEDFLKKYGSVAPKRYHYSDVKKMTNSFKIKLGQGGYGSVFKGKLEDGRLVAVKILKESKGDGEEFINEVASISRTSHVNIVTLLGFCFQGDKKALIYEFMANGSLEKFIYGEMLSVNRQLDWPTLYKIVVGIARGLEYLHRGCNTRILHFDIKPHNILLDEDFCPKISDFGLAKIFPAKESILSILTARGTIGYIAPEVVCRNIGGISHKSDVYSYGMMVLEMVGGRKNVDDGIDHSSQIYFPHWIYTRLDQGEELGLLGIMNEEENKQARKMLIVSFWCMQTHPSNRPTITNVLEMLEGPLEALQMPPKPFFFSPSRASSDSQSTTFIT